MKTLSKPTVAFLASLAAAPIMKGWQGKDLRDDLQKASDWLRQQKSDRPDGGLISAVGDAIEDHLDKPSMSTSFVLMLLALAGAKHSNREGLLGDLDALVAAITELPPKAMQSPALYALHAVVEEAAKDKEAAKAKAKQMAAEEAAMWHDTDLDDDEEQP